MLQNLEFNYKKLPDHEMGLVESNHVNFFPLGALKGRGIKLPYKVTFSSKVLIPPGKIRKLPSIHIILLDYISITGTTMIK